MNPQPNFNFQLNRLIMWDGDPDKKKYYVKATEIFYDYHEEIFASGEELFIPMLYMAENGFDVYLFEGPGQGGVMRVQGKHFTYQWEKPVKAVLDYFHLDDVTIIGASLGGMLAPRAAAFEKRIQRVIAWSIFPNFLDILLPTADEGNGKTIKAAKWLLKHKCRAILNFIFHIKAKKDETVRWGLEHGKYAYQAKYAYEYAVKMNQYQVLNIADKITQDMLTAGANKTTLFRMKWLEQSFQH